MSSIKISPTGDTAAFRLEIFEWSNKEQKDIRMGDFYVFAKNGQLVVSGMKDWRTNHRDPVAIIYYENEPKFREVTVKPFDSVFIKQLLSATVPEACVDKQRSTSMSSVPLMSSMTLECWNYLQGVTSHSVNVEISRDGFCDKDCDNRACFLNKIHRGKEKP